MEDRAKKSIGWITAAAAFLMIGVWSYWGINETFHEGWYYPSLWQNILLAVTQYLSVPIMFLALSVFALYYKKAGTALIIACGLAAIFFFDSSAGRVVIAIPLALFALGFYRGAFTHRKICAYSFVGIFAIIVLLFGIPHVIRVEHRYNDNNFGTRDVIGNEVTLTWAAQGDGFPLTGVPHSDAQQACSKLDPQGTWRLPTREELVRSLTRDNQNAGGYIDDSGTVHYTTRPDKETPLWNPHSQVIYYWTSESADETRAYLVAYNGYILERSKTSGANYQGYRCVTDSQNENY